MNFPFVISGATIVVVSTLCLAVRADAPVPVLDSVPWPIGPDELRHYLDRYDIDADQGSIIRAQQEYVIRWRSLFHDRYLPFLERMARVPAGPYMMTSKEKMDDLFKEHRGLHASAARIDDLFLTAISGDLDEAGLIGMDRVRLARARTRYLHELSRYALQGEPGFDVDVAGWVDEIWAGRDGVIPPEVVAECEVYERQLATQLGRVHECSMELYVEFLGELEAFGLGEWELQNGEISTAVTNEVRTEAWRRVEVELKQVASQVTMLHGRTVERISQVVSLQDALVLHHWYLEIAFPELPPRRGAPLLWFLLTEEPVDEAKLHSIELLGEQYLSQVTAPIDNMILRIREFRQQKSMFRRDSRAVDEDEAWRRYASRLGRIDERFLSALEDMQIAATSSTRFPPIPQALSTAASLVRQLLDIRAFVLPEIPILNTEQYFVAIKPQWNRDQSVLVAAFIGEYKSWWSENPDLVPDGRVVTVDSATKAQEILDFQDRRLQAVEIVERELFSAIELVCTTSDQLSALELIRRTRSRELKRIGNRSGYASSGVLADVVWNNDLCEFLIAVPHSSSDICEIWTAYEQELTPLVDERHRGWRSWFGSLLNLRVAEAAAIDLRERMEEGAVDVGTRKRVQDELRAALRAYSQTTRDLRVAELRMARLHVATANELAELRDTPLQAAVSKLIEKRSTMRIGFDTANASDDRLRDLCDRLILAAVERLEVPTQAEQGGRDAIVQDVRTDAELRWLRAEYDLVHFWGEHGFSP